MRENLSSFEAPDILRRWSRRDFLVRSGQGAAVLATAGSLAAVLEACGVSSGSSTSSQVNTSGLPPVPKVANPKKLSGKLVISGAGSGVGGQMDKLAGAQFQKDTGAQVSFIPPPSSTSDLYAQYQRLLTSKSTTPDVLQIDVVYPGAFAQFLAPLDSLIGDQAKLHYPTIVQNNTVGGKLVGIPWFGDFGLLFYRKDLVQKYGFSGPPATWQELTDQATKIQAGEKASNPSFSGMVFQGNAYEGLTCDALEWVASYGGNFITNNQVTADSPQAKAALTLAQSWIGKISPTGVTSFQEEDSRGAFDEGNAAFMRNWPYAYSISKDPKNSKVSDKFDVAALPHGPNGESVATVGGWQLAINGASQNVAAAAEFIKYMTGTEMQKYRAVAGSFVPTQPQVAQDPEVLKVMPFLTVQTTRVTRPSALGTKYNQGSTFIFQGVNQILRGQDVSSSLKQMQTSLQGLL